MLGTAALCTCRWRSLIGQGIPSSPGRAYAVTMQILLRRLLAPGLIAAALAAFVVSGLGQDGTRLRPPAETRGWSPYGRYVDTSAGCEHLVEGCTIGKRVNTGQVKITIRPATTP
jgi:hypothetical protein